MERITTNKPTEVTMTNKNERIKELEKSSKEFMEMGNNALMTNTSESFRNLMTENEKKMWITGYLTAFVEIQQNIKGDNK
jgi:hypothetical protein